MPDNNPTPWPPAPPEGKAQATKPAANNIAGWISLVMACLGVLYIIASFAAASRSGTVLMISWPVVTIWWVVAFLLGVVGRRSLPGKIGLILTVAVIILTAVAFAWLVARPAVAPVSAPTVPSVPSK